MSESRGRITVSTGVILLSVIFITALGSLLAGCATDMQEYEMS